MATLCCSLVVFLLRQWNKGLNMWSFPRHACLTRENSLILNIFSTLLGFTFSRVFLICTWCIKFKLRVCMYSTYCEIKNDLMRSTKVLPSPVESTWLSSHSQISPQWSLFTNIILFGLFCESQRKGLFFSSTLCAFTIHFFYRRRCQMRRLTLFCRQFSESPHHGLRFLLEHRGQPIFSDGRCFTQELVSFLRAKNWILMSRRRDMSWGGRHHHVFV